jgi:hypothetical protein
VLATGNIISNTIRKDLQGESMLGTHRTTFKKMVIHFGKLSHWEMTKFAESSSQTRCPRREPLPLVGASTAEVVVLPFMRHGKHNLGAFILH